VSFGTPVFTGRVNKKHCTGDRTVSTSHQKMLAIAPVSTAREHGCSVHTTRVHGPCTRVVWTVNTARDHRCRPK